MMPLAQGVVALAALLAAALAAPGPGPQIKTIFQFPNDSFVENLAVRPNGQVLVTTLTSTELVLVDPARPGRAALVHDFAGAHALSGVAEYRPDVFAVLAGEYHFGSTTGAFGQGTWTLWSVDLRGVDVAPGEAGGDGGALQLARPPVVRRIRRVAEAQLLNGLAAVSGRTLLAGDTLAGVVYAVDAETGAYDVAINSTYLSKLDTPHGVNGIHVVGGDTLYFANSGQNTIVKVPIRQDGTVAGPFVILSNATKPDDEYDDFAVDCAGNIFVATEGGNTIEKISPDGKQQLVVAGSLNSTAIAEPTAAAFGRGASDQNVLYVTTAGGSAIPIQGDIIIPGALLAVETDSWGVC